MSNNNLIHLLEELAHVSNEAKYGNEYAFKRVRELTLELQQAGWEDHQVYFLIRELHSPDNYPVRGPEYMSKLDYTPPPEGRRLKKVLKHRKTERPSDEEHIIDRLVQLTEAWVETGAVSDLENARAVAGHLTPRNYTFDQIEALLRANVTGYGETVTEGIH